MNILCKPTTGATGNAPNLLSDEQAQAIRAILQQEDNLMGVVILRHKRENTGHRVGKYGNYIQCDTCGYHAHTSGHGYLIQHNADYSVVNHLTE